MLENHDQVADLLAKDPGRRRIPRLACAKTLAAAASRLAHAQGVLLISGFYIGRAQAWETDGPPGALVVAAALTQVGIPCMVCTDVGAVPIFSAASKALALELPIKGYESGAKPSFNMSPLPHVDTLVSIERPGQAADGEYYNANGDVVSSHVANFDLMFTEANNLGITTIAVGDGGNELGFGTRLDEAELLLGKMGKIAAVTPAEFLIAAGVSNWGGYALAAAVARMHNVALACSEDKLGKALQKMVEAGAIDGVRGTATASVDGLPLDIEMAMFKSWKNVFNDAGGIHKRWAELV